MTCALVNPTSGYRTFSRLVSLSVRPSICTSTEVSLATFADHLACFLVGTESLERRRPELAAARPFHELELGDDLRLHEMRRPWRGPDVEWTFLGGERLQQLVQLLQRRVRESCAHLARVYEFAAV